jgi:hypothetical protein
VRAACGARRTRSGKSAWRSTSSSSLRRTTAPKAPAAGALAAARRDGWGSISARERRAEERGAVTKGGTRSQVASARPLPAQQARKTGKRRDLQAPHRGLRSTAPQAYASDAASAAAEATCVRDRARPASAAWQRCDCSRATAVLRSCHGARSAVRAEVGASRSVALTKQTRGRAPLFLQLVYESCTTAPPAPRRAGGPAHPRCAPPGSLGARARLGAPGQRCSAWKRGENGKQSRSCPTFPGRTAAGLPPYRWRTRPRHAASMKRQAAGGATRRGGGGACLPSTDAVARRSLGERTRPTLRPMRCCASGSRTTSSRRSS